MSLAKIFYGIFMNFIKVEAHQSSVLLRSRQKNDLLEPMAFALVN